MADWSMWILWLHIAQSYWKRPINLFLKSVLFQEALSFMSDRNPDDCIVYLHGRPDAHPLHKAFANSVTANHFHVDAPIRWQDKNYNAVILIFIWIFNALLFPFRKYSVYLIDNLHVSVILFKKFLSFRKRKFICRIDVKLWCSWNWRNIDIIIRQIINIGSDPPVFRIPIF